MNNFYFGFLLGSAGSYYIINNKIKIVSKIIDLYVDFKHTFNLTTNETNERKERNEENEQHEKIEQIIKDDIVFIDDNQYIYWHPKENEIKHSINSKQSTISFNIIKGEIKDKELFMKVIEKFAGYYGDFNNNVPTCKILNIYEPRLELNSKIIIQNDNYEEFIIN